jgi:fatty acid desaturase
MFSPQTKIKAANVLIPLALLLAVVSLATEGWLWAVLWLVAIVPGQALNRRYARRQLGMSDWL